ncbi:MAG: M1 family metallopeptidase [Spirosomataceae bacterium]
MKKLLTIVATVGVCWSASAQFGQNNNYNANNRFEQMGTSLPTPNTYRTASGAPGKDYWQQRADYDIKVELDDANQKIIGSETITYTNYSPDALPYLWLQLDQNLFKNDAISKLTQTGGIGQNGLSSRSGAISQLTDKKEYGYNITAVKDVKGAPLRYTINNTMMRIELPTPLKTGQAVSFSIDWNYLITSYYGRSGYEFFAKDGNYNYFIAHWFPRLAVYDDVNGWQHKQFLGQGEFTLCFGNYKVAITAPNDHVVGATGELQNTAQVLSATQLKRFEEAKKNFKEPVVIVSQEEAVAAEKAKPTGKKTWVFAAQNVRDFAFTSSRKFIWDAMMANVEGKNVLCMSYYSKEGNPLWGKYSTQVVAHTLKSYSSHTFQYPYPVAISCHATAGGGMEYPMICFNGGRPEEDGTYSEGTKKGMIGVIIHEVGHNFFPMIVNSDERQWSWMDEGLNSFLQYLAENEWERDFATGAEPQNIVNYMKTDPTQQVPIMSSSDNIMAFGPNAYTKPATALNILRETVMGRELFDYAFKEYSRRWMFKSPTPADFFRTMEDASGVDLDWFWKSWFYGVEPVDQDLADVQWFALDPQDPAKQKAAQKATDEAKKKTLASTRNKTDIKQTAVEANPSLADFYTTYDRYAVTDADKKKQEAYLATLTADERKLLEDGYNFYTINLKNKGGVPMPVILKAQYEDGTDEIFRIPAEIWRLNDKDVKKIIPTKKRVTQWTLDPFFEIADIDTANNSFPRQPAEPTKFQLFKANFPRQQNPMQQQQRQAPGAVQGAPRN